MKKLLFIGLMMPFFLLACGGDDLPQDYTVPEPRILAIKIEDPEVEPGGSVSMRMLMAGKRIHQAMSNPVKWYLEANPPIFLGTSPYNADFIAEIPPGILSGGKDPLDLSILAEIEVENKSYFARKQMRITQNPKGKNPMISEIDVRYKDGNETVQKRIGEGDVIRIGNQTGAVSFTVHTVNLAEGENDQLIYRWYASDAKQGIGRIYAYEDKDITGELLGLGVKVGEGLQSVVFSLKGEANDGGLESGIYDVYIVIRDNAADSQSSAEDRFGTDFIYFTLCVNTDC